MKRIIAILLPLFLLTLTACTEEKLAFEVEAAPVLGVIAAAPADAGMVSYAGTFYELDKSGILDQAVGIDSLPVAGLELKVFSQASELLQTLTTDVDGNAVFTASATDLDDVTRLEWTGRHNDKNFRILVSL